MTKDERNGKIEEILIKFAKQSPEKGKWWSVDLEIAKSEIENLFKEPISER